MVRVNLLPEKRQVKQRTTSEPGQAWVLAVFAVILLEVLGLIAVQAVKNKELAAAVVVNGGIQGQIDSINSQIADQAQIKAQLQTLRDRESAIQKLQSGRTGPTNIMMELARILTPGRGPTIDKAKLDKVKHENPTAAPNPNWDGRRLWLTQYSEIERTVRIVGLAKDPEDVSEFERRLVLSDFFFDVNLLPGARVTDQVTKTDVVRFELSAKVRY
jgi:type IV pilus assembly protein PilN